MSACGDARVNVLVPDGSWSFAIMDFTDSFPLEPLPAGWYHRRFWRHGPMDISFEMKEGSQRSVWPRTTPPPCFFGTWMLPSMCIPS